MKNILKCSFLVTCSWLCFSQSYAQTETAVDSIPPEENLENLLKNLDKDIRKFAQNLNINLDTEETKKRVEKLILNREVRKIERTYNQTILTHPDQYFIFLTNATTIKNEHKSLCVSNMNLIDTLILSKVRSVVETQIDTSLLLPRNKYHIQFKVMGFASPDGPEELNLALSQKRASSIAQLLSQHQSKHKYFTVSYIPFGRGENVMPEMQKLDNRYKRSVLVILDRVDIIQEEDLLERQETFELDFE